MVNDQKTFIGNASHELRTPLTSLKTEIEVALRDQKMTTAEARKLLKSNLEDVDSMQRLSNYLLELNRYENSEIKLETKKIELSGIIQKSIEKVKPVADKQKIKIKKTLVKVYVKGNEDALIELSKILIENAIKYSSPGKSIEIKTKKNGIFEVKDNGIGIAEKDVPYIFNRFYRVEPSRSKLKVDGYGLGLSIAKSIVDKLGGKIRVVSKIEKGSTFSIQLQLA
jgi:signal transduction histidine kinase